jgi:membrane fusion protein, adhesin transport system
MKHKLIQFKHQWLALTSEQRLLSTLLGLVVLALLWAMLMSVDRIVRAEGRIIAAGRSQVVQHLEGGIVSEIHVREGQMVKAGDVLMKFSTAQANSSFLQGQSQLEVLQARRARLEAEDQGLAQPKFDASVSETIAQQELNLMRVRLSHLQSERSVLSQQVDQRQAELSEARTRAASLLQELTLAKRQSGLMEGLLQKGAASQMEMLEAQGRTQRLNTQHNDVASSIPRLQAAVLENQARLSELVSRYKSEVRNELNEVSATLANTTHVVSGEEDRLARTEVRSPVAGYVNRLHFNTIGGVAKPGEPLLEITPSEGRVAVEARVRPDDRGALRPGLETRVLIGAYDYAVYGALTGKLVEVSADTVPDEQGQRYYRVLIETDAAEGALAQQAILPGMTARADVVLGQRSIASYVFSPLLRFAHRALREPT